MSNRPTTLVLTQADIARSLSIKECIAAVETAFVLGAQDKMAVPQVAHLPAVKGAFHVKSAAYRLEPHYVAVKVNGNFPTNPRLRGLPTIQGAILLSDGRDGRLLAIMDSIEVTALRTGAATAVAARQLAHGKPHIACIIGCGVQGRIQLRSILEVFDLDRIYAADENPEQARHFADEMRHETDREVIAVDHFEDVTRESQIIITCTPARRAFVEPQHVSPGTFVAAVGADDSTKQEIAPELMARAKVVVDSLDQCAQMGDLRHAIAAGAMRRDDVAAELGDLVAGLVGVDVSGGHVMVFDSTGVAIEDVAAAGVIYERASAEGLGQAVVLN